MFYEKDLIMNNEQQISKISKSVLNKFVFNVKTEN